jgi:ribosome-associated protein
MAGAAKRATIEEIQEAAAVAARAAWSKGGADTVVLGVAGVLAITDAFVITSGSNPRMVRTIAEEIEKKVKESASRSPLAVEGLDDARWVLIDYGDFVVHVFIDEARDFYQFDRLWSDAIRWEWESEEQKAAALASGE